MKTQSPLRKVAILFIATLIFASCQKEEFAPFTTIENDEQIEFLILASEESDTEINEDSTVDQTGKHRKCGRITEVDIESLPAVIITFLDSAYVDNVINKAGQFQSGYFAVFITKADETKAIITFDSTGVFVKEKSLTKERRYTKIDASDLPAISQTYIDDNYSTATIIKALQKNTGEYKVVLKLADEAGYTVLTFDSDGAFVKAMELKRRR